MEVPKAVEIVFRFIITLPCASASKNILMGEECKGGGGSVAGE